MRPSEEVWLQPLSPKLLEQAVEIVTKTQLKSFAGVGKSTFCLTACCMTAIDERYGGLGANVAFIDTEDKFCAKRFFLPPSEPRNPISPRLLQIAKERFQCNSVPDLENVASRCLLLKCASTHALADCLSKLDNIIIERQIKLIGILLYFFSEISRSKYKFFLFSLRF